MVAALQAEGGALNRHGKFPASTMAGHRENKPFPEPARVDFAGGLPYNPSLIRKAYKRGMS